MDPRNCTVLYKILTPSERQSLPNSSWQGTELDLKDGFIHLSTSEQIPWVLEKFFHKNSEIGDVLFLHVLPRSNIDEDKLRFDTVGQTVFGHIYGTLDLAQFTEAIEIHRDINTHKFNLGSLTF